MRRGSLYVIAQFSLLILLAVSSQKQPGLVSYSLAGVAIILGVWALTSLPQESLTVMPEAKPQARFTKRGPYRVIRHPMYTALMTLGVAMWWVEPTYWRFAVLLALVAILSFKSAYEERILLAKYPQYAAYRTRTARFIPYII